MYRIPIYKAEVEAGLKETLLAVGSVAFASLVEPADKFALGKSAWETVKNYSSKASLEDFDLFYLKTLMVSTGENQNDDYFDPVELWSARATPEDKPWNYEHDSTDIIGHIISTTAVDDTEKEIPDDTTTDTLPAKFHLITGGVLYKYYDDKERQERTNVILREIAEKKWSVSMECLFRGFDYYLKDGDDIKVIARNSETAFLTKYLRAYGGTGQYEEKKLGRYFRNITFSGKGLVRNPANPNSKIFTAQAKLGYSISSTHTENKQVTIELETLQKQFDELTAKYTEESNLHAQAKLAVKAKDDELKLAIDGHTKLENEFTELKTAFASVTDELSKLKIEKSTAFRLATAKEKLKFSAEVAAEFIENSSALSDEQFAKQVETLAKATVKPAEKQKIDNGVDKVNLASLDKAEPIPEPTLATAAEDSANAKLSTDILKFFDCEDK